MTDEGFKAPRCATCGHVVGDHQSGRSMNPLAKSRYGLCRAPGCECREFVKFEEKP